ncbi:hypothetical protein N0V93_003162 [Gnomoniopsis smithogilvyi]|uniref:Uncharacterized protein n=1 Tax=Gnomoniopsis smithogilvyi TaxID=1191159 RepID=A0A9W8YW49_9PEZI|nr:hypothetical protein N0V93_003162 [Gnomoniopsis smithogilvyi]
MDFSAPKRRKTSPTGSVPIESTTPADPPPPQQSQQSRAPQSSPSRSPTRPSFASPTKSSLARHNPEILSQRRGTAAQRSDDRPASELNEEVDVDAALTAQLEHHSEGVRVTSPPEASTSTALPTVGEAPNTAAAVASDLLRSPSRRVGGSTLGAQSARRTPTRPQPRPLPPPGPEEEDIIANPFGGRGLNRSPLNTGVLPAVVYEEPELPPTPEQPDPVLSTPPSGIHNTPSKRRRDPNEREAVRQQSSPSKHPLSQEVTSPLNSPQKQSQKPKGKRRASPVKIIGQVASLPERSREKETPPPVKTSSEFVPGTHPRRSIRLRGPNWEKQQERDSLLKEIAKLQADLDLAKRGNQNAAQGLPLADKGAVLDVLRRHLVPAEKEPERDTTTEWIQAVMDPIAMLGFNGSSKLNLPPAFPHQDAEDEPEPPIVSHHPICMNASEELPYLQIFTPLTYSSVMTTITPSDDEPSQPTLQKHSITVHSANPPGLFTARLEMVVNPRKQTIYSLVVPRLDPAAAPELDSFIDRIVSPQAQYHPVLTRNVNILCWAMGEWYGIALQRAKFWVALERALDSKDGLIEIVLAMRARKKRKRRRQGQSGEADSEIGEGFTVGSDSDPQLPDKSRLLPHMGRTSMDFQIPYLTGDGTTELSELRVKWTMEFDWAGEARSRLGVELGVPGKWQAMDERKSIVGIPNMFDKLVQGGEDPLMAVQTVVALLAGEPGS